MALLHLLFIFTTLFSLSYSDHFLNMCLEGKIIGYCQCENIPSEHSKSQAEVKITCSGSKALEAATNTVNMAKGNKISIELHIFNTTIDEILYRDLKNFSHLKLLSFTGSYITNIENGAFKEQGSLVVLDLSMNQLITIKSYMFEPLINLTNLSLANNQIHHIDPNTFHKMSMLQNLDLSGNGLKSIDNALFSGSKNLETLSLKSNNIKMLESKPFQELFHLQELDLSFNELKEIAPTTFFHLKSLKFLSLAMNKFETLNDSAFKRNVLLEKVNLTGNMWNCDKKLLLLNDWLEKYEPNKEGALCTNPPKFQNYTIQHGLQILNLEINVQESPICNATMCNCTIAHDKLVITVDCSGKGFTRLPEIIPYKTKVLNLCNNNIKSLTIDHIDNAMWDGVSFLHLNNNVINSLKGLEGTWLLRNLVGFHVSNNYLTEIPIHVLEQFRSGLLDEIYLSGNPWNCDCNTVRFQTWLQDNYKIVRELESILCSSNNGDHSNQVIVRLSKSQLCPQHETLVNYLDILNGLMAVAIVLIVLKLAYDYQLQKRTGKLPRFFSLNVS